MRCPYLDAGCEYTGERLLLGSHLELQCGYVQVPCLCSDKSCKRTVARKDALDGHAVVHQESDPEVRRCYRFQFQGDLTCICRFKSDNSRTIPCEFCEEEFSCVSAMKIHVANNCAEKIVSCDQAENGCTWNGRRISLRAHVDKCPYESIKGFFAIHNREMMQLSKDNKRLRGRTEELEGTVRVLKQELEWAKIALGPWYRPVYTERPALIANYAQYLNGEGASAGPILLRGIDPMTGGTSHPRPRVEDGTTETFGFFDPFSFVGQTRDHDPNIHAANNGSPTTIVTSTEPNLSTHASTQAIESGNGHDIDVSNGLEITASVLSPGARNYQSTSTTLSTALLSDHFPSENQVALEEEGSFSRSQGWRHALPPNSMSSNPSPGIHSPVSIPVLPTQNSRFTVIR